MTRLVLALACLATGAACRSSTPVAPGPATPAGAEADACSGDVRPAAAPATSPGPGRGAHPGQKPKPRLPIFVGGCRDACREPVSAFRAFLAALASDLEGKAVVPYLNTAELVVNGERYGDRWAEFWKRGQWTERQSDIEAFTASFLAWARGLDDPGELQAAIRDGVRVIRDESERGELAWHHPSLTGDMTAPDWRFILKPRGLEWLIVEIDQYTKGAP